MCPVTGQPDFWTARIAYRPGSKCVESKSLKLYLQTFREEGVFVEKLADTIATDLQAVLFALHVQVTIHQSTRGGIDIIATAEKGARL